MKYFGVGKDGANGVNGANGVDGRDGAPGPAGAQGLFYFIVESFLNEKFEMKKKLS